MVFSLVVFITGCVSASLDDVGLSDDNLTLAGNQPDTAPEIAPNITNAALSDVSSEPTNSGETSANPAPSVVTTDELPVQISNVATTSRLEPISQQNRDQAIAEIRAKAASTGNAPPQIGDVPVSTIKHLTAREQALSKAELQAEAQAARGLISDSELAAKRAEFALLRKKAKSHYNQALQQIQN